MKLSRGFNYSISFRETETAKYAETSQSGAKPLRISVRPRRLLRLNKHVKQRNDQGSEGPRLAGMNDCYNHWYFKMKGWPAILTIETSFGNSQI